ncbi:MAG: hypothetical protein LBJ77_04035, partial [Holosporales bacterium]|nr:hypothetical protein [Holosporales bacterium]
YSATTTIFGWTSRLPVYHPAGATRSISNAVARLQRSTIQPAHNRWREKSYCCRRARMGSPGTSKQQTPSSTGTSQSDRSGIISL